MCGELGRIADGVLGARQDLAGRPFDAATAGTSRLTFSGMAAIGLGRGRCSCRRLSLLAGMRCSTGASRGSRGADVVPGGGGTARSDPRPPVAALLQAKTLSW